MDDDVWVWTQPWLARELSGFPASHVDETLLVDMNGNQKSQPDKPRYQVSKIKHKKYVM